MKYCILGASGKNLAKRSSVNGNPRFFKQPQSDIEHVQAVGDINII